LLSSSHHIVEYLLTNHLSDIDVNCWFDMEQPYPEEYADMFPSSIHRTDQSDSNIATQQQSTH
jgi:hypothetical protein